tara:strand:+ start:190 stop:297 length:108 start_codon:yes stop_codon:yes gene_type:complete
MKPATKETNMFVIPMTAYVGVIVLVGTVGTILGNR